MVTVSTIAPNQVTIFDNIGTTLFSYDTPICTRPYNGSVILYPAWRYSKTTSKYRRQFLNGESTKETQSKLDKNIYILKDYYAKN